MVAQLPEFSPPETPGENGKKPLQETQRFKCFTVDQRIGSDILEGAVVK